MSAIKVGVLGAGSWGTALAVLLHNNGNQVTLWEFIPEVAERLDRDRINPEFLPNIHIPQMMSITSDLAEAVQHQDIVLVTLPSHVVRQVSEAIAKLDNVTGVFVSASKGIENETLQRMSEVLAGTIPGLGNDRIVILSGPSHAEEVAMCVPTAITAASVSFEAAKLIQQVFMNPTFRVYTNPDVTGVELGGAVKNVIAIAAGICDGVGFGDNSKAALINRGIVEITRLGTALGAKPITFAGLSGMGDLIATCCSRHSRNRHVGEAIGRGKTLKQVLDEMVQVAEGVRTTRSVYDLSRKHGIEMPITKEIFHVLFEDKKPKDAVYDLMTRDPKAEDWG